MKHKLLLLLSSAFFAASGQNQTIVPIKPSEYDALKTSNQLDLSKKYVFSNWELDTKQVPVKYNGQVRTPSSICNCMLTLDSTYSVVPFVGSPPPDYRNDDMSSPSLALPFTFNFYGVNYNQVFINTNGNISFTAPYFNFTANPFPDPSFNMIAPFWADVDTRHPMSGLVYYKITPTALIVKWDNVGYFNTHDDKLNTFQLIITDGTDTLLPSGVNVGFCYGDMQWTTGDASGGVGGFYGYPATVGVNQGNGVDYFQSGTFDQSSTLFDGPYNAADGVDWLDNQGMYFDVATVGNIPPVVINNNICDTIDIYTGDTLRTMNIDSVMFNLAVTTPEISQTVSATIVCSEPSAFSYTEVMNTATYKEYACKFIATNLPVGLYFVDITATDNGVPSKQVTRRVVIRSNYDPSVLGINENFKIKMDVYPNPTDGLLTIRHDFDLSSSAIITVTDILGKTVLSNSLTQQTQTIDITELNKGIYFLSIISKNGSSKTIKVVRN
jgi:hypothetical protein